MSRQNKNRGFGYFLAELLILILGISASFILNEYRISKAEESKEIELLNSFHENLTIDSTLLSAYVNVYERQIEIANSILGLERNASYTDSTARNVLGLLSYSPFSPSEITYQEMKSLGQSHILQNDTLLTELITLYEVNYESLQQWTDVDGAHVKKQLIPYMMENFPYVNGLNFPTMTAAQKREFMRQVNSDRYRYLIQFAASYKVSTKTVYEGILNEVRNVIDMINQELPSEEPSVE